MSYKTSENNGHIHAWDATLIDGKVVGKTDRMMGHAHKIKVSFAGCDNSYATEASQEHVHSISLPETFRVRAGLSDAEANDYPYGPEGTDLEKDDLKIGKRKKEDEEISLQSKEEPKMLSPEQVHTPAPFPKKPEEVDMACKKPEDEKDFAGKYIDKEWDGSTGRFEIEQLRKSVPAAMREWGDAQAKNAPDGKPRKEDYKLQYREPDGTINVNGVRNALARASQVKGVPAETIKAAITELQSVLAAAKKAGFSAGGDIIVLNFTSANQPDLVIVEDEKIFRTGTWNGVKIDGPYLDKMVENYHLLKSSFEPALKAGHRMADHAKFFGELSAGWAQELRRVGDWLVARFAYPKEIYNKYIKSGMLRHKSCEVIPNFVRNGKEYGPVLTGVALLGVSTPALNDLGAVQLPFSEEAQTVLSLEVDCGGDEMSVEEKKVFEDKIAGLEAEKKDFAEKFAALEAEKKASEEKMLALTAQIRAKEAKAKANVLKESGKLLPKNEYLFAQVLLSLGTEQMLTFAAEEGKDPVKMSQTEMFLKLFEDAAPQVKLNTEITDAATDKKPTTPDTGVKTPSQTMPKSIPFADKLADIAKANGWDLKGVDEYEAAVKMAADSNGKLSYEQALAMIYSQQEANKK
jgi:hypothetical protein